MPSSPSNEYPPRHAAALDSQYVRSLVSSTPTLDTPPRTILTATPRSRKTITVTADSSTWNAHLAQLLHSMCLVSLIEKAQIGALHNRIDLPTDTECHTRKVGPPSPSSIGPTLGRRTPVHSVAINDRWLSAVTRHCRYTCTIDDVARVAMVFSDFVQVSWGLQAWNNTASLAADGREAHRDPTLLYPFPEPDKPLDPRSSKPAASGGRLQGRLYLSIHHVISVDEAEGHLERALQLKGTAAAQRAWRELVNHHTAYAAYLCSKEKSAMPSLHVAVAGDVAPMPPSSADTTLTSTTVDHSHGDGHSPDCEVGDEKLIGQLSAELRASVSPSMLRALLLQMRRDAARTEEREQLRTAEQQLNERLVSAYEQVRALLGKRQANSRSAWSLLVAMREESRFSGALDNTALLSRLLRINASGLSATRLREAAIPLDPPLVPKVAKRKNHRGKRKREAEAVDMVLLPCVAQPTLESITDLEGLTEEDLKLVRIQLSRANSSVKSVMEAIEQNLT